MQMEPIFVWSHMSSGQEHHFSCWECCSGFAWLQLSKSWMVIEGGSQGKREHPKSYKGTSTIFRKRERICKLRSSLCHPWWERGKLLCSNLHSTSVPRVSSAIWPHLLPYNFLKFSLFWKQGVFTVNLQGVILSISLLIKFELFLFL